MIGPVHRLLRRHVSVMGSVVAVVTDQPSIVMTFDDGPEPGQSESVLEALADGGATATFFLLSNRAAALPSLVREIAAAGHEIALHGVDHRPLNAFSPAEVRERTAAGRAALEDIVGVPLRWMRPPYGRQSPRRFQAVRAAGLMPVLWGSTSLDSVDAPEDARIASVARGLKPGTILLCHDGRAGVADGVNDPPIPAFDRGTLTRRILDMYKTKGLNAQSLGNALLTGTPRLRAWFT